MGMNPAWKRYNIRVVWLSVLYAIRLTFGAAGRC